MTQNPKLTIKPHPEEHELQVTMKGATREEIDEMKEKYGFASRAQAVRHFLQIGMKSIEQNDPRNQNTDSDYQATTVRELIPEGKDNSIDPREDLIERIEQELPSIIENDPNIKKDGWEVYRDEG